VPERAGLARQRLRVWVLHLKQGGCQDPAPLAEPRRRKYGMKGWRPNGRYRGENTEVIAKQNHGLLRSR